MADMPQEETIKYCEKEGYRRVSLYPSLFEEGNDYDEL